MDNNNISNIQSLEHEQNRIDKNDDILKSVQSEESHKNRNNATSVMRQKTNKTEKKEIRYKCNHSNCYKSYRHKNSLKRHIMIHVNTAAKHFIEVIN